MPNYKGHLVGGTVAFAGLLYLLYDHQPSLLTVGEWYLCAIAGCLFPDIDTKSKGQKYFYRLISLIVVVLFVQVRFKAVAFVSLVALAPLLVRHRGITHSFSFIAFLCAVVVAYAHLAMPQYASIVFFNCLFFFIGAVSHLWLDLGFWKMIKK